MLSKILLINSVFVIAILIGTLSWAGGKDLIQKGHSAQQTERYNEALEAYTQASEATDLNKYGRAYAFYKRGSLWGFLGENIKGIDDFSKSIALNPKYANAFNNRGIAYSKKGLYDRTIADYDPSCTFAINIIRLTSHNFFRQTNSS